MTSFIFLISFLSWISLALFSLFHVFNKQNKKLPPSPKGIPFLGHLLMLGKNPHRDLNKLAKKHGPIMYMKLGLVPHIIVSSPQAAEQFLRTHDVVFASRPPNEASKYIAYNQKNITFSEYGPYLRGMRKMCSLELLSTHKINSFEPMRREEIRLFIESIKQVAGEKVAVNLSTKVASLTAEMGCRMVFGRKYEHKDINDKGFKFVLQEVMKLVVAQNLGEYFPFLQKFDIQGLKKRMKGVSVVIDGFLETIIDEHVRDGNDERRTKDFVDTMMSVVQSGDTDFEFDRRHVKASMLDMFAGATDTTFATIEWMLSELLKHPNVMEKLQKELEQVVGLNRMVEESDLNHLHYMHNVVKETLRLHPVGPLLVPRYATQDSIVDGYDIPKHSRVIINAFSIGRDPNSWDDPDKFVPERFIGSDVDLRGQHFRLIPFGSGRRSCPGMELGLIIVGIIGAQLVHCFDWKLENDDMLPEDLDMDEEFGLVVSRANHLMAVPSYRLLV